MWRESRVRRGAASWACIERLQSRCMLSATVFEHNDVGYFLNQDEPSVERFDIANEVWLAPIDFAGASGAPTVAHADDEGIYVAYGKAVYRYNLDGTGQTHLLNAPDDVIAIHSDGKLLFINHTSGLYARVISIDKSTNTVIDTFENYVDSVHGSSIAVGVNRIFGRRLNVSPGDLTYVSYNDAGTFTGGGDGPYHGDFPNASTTWVFPAGTNVVDNSGTIYATDNLTRLNSFAAMIDDIDFYGADVPIILSGSMLTAYSQALLPTGSYALGHTPSDIFVNDTNVITFRADAASPTGFFAAIVPLTELDPPAPGTPVDPDGLAYTPDEVEIASDGTLLLYSKSHQSLFRWDPLTQGYVDSISLIGTADHIAYSAETNRVYLAYQSGLITQIDFDAAQPSEVPFTTLPGSPIGLSSAGLYLFAVDPSGSWDSHYTFAPNGTLVDSVEWNYFSTEYVWSDANQKMYFFRDDTSPNDLLWEETNADGVTYPSEPAGGIGSKMDSPLHSSAGFTHPIRVAPDGSIVVLGSGLLHDAHTLERMTLSLANAITDAAWLGGTLFTMRNNSGGTQFQRWATPTYANNKVLQTSGTPHALLAVSDTRLVGISIDGGGVPVFSLLDANLVDHSVSRDVIYVNDDFTQADGMEIADADPNTPGNQRAIIGANAFDTIQEGIDAVDDGGVVKVTDDLSSDGAGFYSENVSILKDLTVRGTESDPTAVILDGGASGRVAFIGPYDVTLTSLTVQNGAATTGAGIFNDGGNVLLNNLVVQNNAVVARGGGIYAAGDATTILENSLVTGNTAGWEGGGLWNSNAGSLIVRSESTVSDNTASGNAFDQGGGGLFNHGGRLALVDATIVGNMADGVFGRGGGILSTGGAVTLDDSTLSGNTASFAGGGIDFSDGTVLLTNTHLVSNIAGPAGPGRGRGGGLHVSGQGGRATIDGGTVSDNRAGDQGGGLWNQSGIMIVGGGAVIEGNHASGPTTGGGGGIFNGGGRLAIHSAVTISGNTVDGTNSSGGGLYVGNGTVTIDDSMITGNQAVRSGGGIEVVTGVVQLTNVQLDDNVAGPEGTANPGNGGGMHVFGRAGQVAKITISGGTVSGNTAASEGGGIWNQGPTVMVIRDGTVINGNTASGDAADEGGGGIFHNSGRLAILGSTLSNNTADGSHGSGGGLFVMRGGVTVENGSTITGNSAIRAGGGIEVVTGEVILVDAILASNKAGVTGNASPGNGGGLHITGTERARVDLRNTLVTDNQAALEGGGLWHQTDNVMLVRAGSEVTGNTASGNAADEGGGGIFNNGGRLVLHGALIDGNTADGSSSRGGGLLLLNGATTIEDTTLSGNVANGAGGGIEIANGLLLTVNMTLTDNIAGPAGTANPGNGGGLHITGTTQVRATIEGGEISRNTAAREGGGLWNQAGSILIITGGTTVSGNTASGDAADDGGGGVFNNGGRVAITRAAIWNNDADGTNAAGGGILSLGGVVTLDNSTVSGNTANGDGGGIAILSGEWTAANATIADNRSDADDAGGGAGGGLFNGGLSTLRNTIIAGNHMGAGTTSHDLGGNAVQANSLHNLIGDAASAGGLLDGISGNIVGNGGAGVLILSSILDPLADNGGPTLTHALVANSPAIDAGSNNAAKDVYGIAFTTDKRGPGFPRINNAAVDIGAVEA